MPAVSGSSVALLSSPIASCASNSLILASASSSVFDLYQAGSDAQQLRFARHPPPYTLAGELLSNLRAGVNPFKL